MRVVRPLQALTNMVDIHRASWNADQSLLQLSRSRTMATVTDDPLSRKVEMTNWEQVGYHQRHPGWSSWFFVERLMSNLLGKGKLYQLQVRAL